MTTRTPADHLADSVEDLARLHLAVAIGGYCDPADLADALIHAEHAGRATASDGSADVAHLRAELYTLRADIEATLRADVLADAFRLQRERAADLYPVAA